MKCWLANTKIDALLEDNAKKIDGVKLRMDLVDYCGKYQKIYPFEILEEPIEFLEQNVNSEGKYKEVRALLSIAAEEYCISLNEMADALLVLIETTTLTTDQAKKIINHVFEAFSCNESPEDFLPREDTYLCETLFAMTSS